VATASDAISSATKPLSPVYRPVASRDGHTFDSDILPILSPTPSLLDNLLRAGAPSGYEGPAAAVWREAASFAELTVDGIGSSIARVGDAAPLLAVVGHIDEIGLIITHIDEKGFLWFAPVGGWDPQVLVGQRVEIRGKGGPVLGVVGRKPIHLLEADQRKKVVELKGLHIDVGAGDREEAAELIRVGDPVVIAAEPMPVLGERLASRAMDNRLGAYVALESLRRANERGEMSGSFAAVAAVQEEIGLFGARTAAFEVRPDIAIAVDVTHATDAPGVDEKELGSSPLGSGPAIGRGSTLSPKVFELLVETAEAEGIEHSISASGRGTSTDADVLQISRAGIPTGLVSIPLRYMHSPVEMVDLRDVEATVELLAAFAARLSADVDLSR
jgi:endoglucanase